MMLVGTILGLFTLIAAAAAARYAKKAADEAGRGADYAGEMAGEATKATAAAVVASEAGRDANQIARETAELQSRPWLAITVTPGSDFDIIDRGMFFQIIVEVKNIGAGVARMSYPSLTLIAGSPSQARISELIDTGKEQLARHAAPRVILPTEITGSKHLANFTKDQLASATMGGEHLMITAVVVASYTGLQSDRQFHTVTSFGISTTNGESLLAIKNQNCHIPRALIVLERHVGGGDAAA